MINKDAIFPASTLVILAAMFLTANCASPEIQDDHLNDRVKACSGGFSVSTQGNLHACLKKVELKGGINGGILEETRSIIFSEIPENMRVQAYNDYIKCIQKDWNHG